MYIYRQGTLGWFIEIVPITGSLPYNNKPAITYLGRTATWALGAGLKPSAGPTEDQSNRPKTPLLTYKIDFSVLLLYFSCLDFFAHDLLEQPPNLENFQPKQTGHHSLY